MKNWNIKSALILFAAAYLLTGCYKLQKDDKYVKYELDPHINKTAKDFMNDRGMAGVGNDTVFKWMQMGIQYAGIDLSEYEKPGRTYIFLHNNAVRTLSSGKVNGGFFFDNPIVVKNSSGVPIKSVINPAIDSTRPAVAWNEYSVQTVKNYFLYLIITGEYGFNNLGIDNKSLTTLLPPGQTVPYTESRLGWVVTQTSPNPDILAPVGILIAYPTGGTGFDPEGKINLRLANNDASPIVVNDRTNDRTAGYLATNGQIHVFDKTIWPFRYSY